MKKKLVLTAAMTSMIIYLLSSCYKNKEDVLALPKVSFRGDIVSIVTSGGCGCHNNGKVSNAVAFSHADTVFYDAILARSGVFNTWVNGGTHPGGGGIDFKANDKITMQRWISEGAKDDGGGCTVTGTITYTNNIAAAYTGTCKGSTCHGGLSVNLDYAKMVSKKAEITAMMNSGGATGHPGGTLSLSSCTVKLFSEWLNQGQPQ